MVATEKVGEVIVGLSLSVRTSETVMRFTCGETEEEQCSRPRPILLVLVLACSH